MDTPMVEKSKLDEDKEGKAVDPSHYLCPYQAWPTEKALLQCQRIFWYLRGTVNRVLWYPKDSLIALTAFANADHAGCQDTRHSTSSSMQFLGDRLVSWLSKRKKSAAISSTDAEYIAMLDFTFIKEHFENGVIKLYFVNTEYQLADIFTKALAKERIEFLINKLGMQSFTPETLKHLADEVDEVQIRSLVKGPNSQYSLVSEFAISYYNHSIIKEQQQALDDALVPWEQRLLIGICNYRLSTTFKPKEPTFQVSLDVLSLTPFYPAFLITASVLAIYMHEFWTFASYHKHSIRFKLNIKRYSFDLDTFRNMLQICPKLPGQ
ncbi:hypothetical protein Tco_0369444 [Tanacetum coccineum]